MIFAATQKQDGYYKYWNKTHWNTFIKFTLKTGINLMDLSQYSHKIFSPGLADFDSLALEVFHFQYANNPVYHDYINALQISDASVQSITQIPFLPISFFKSHKVCTTSFIPELIFESSGTTGSINSRHYIKDTEIYRKSFTATFEMNYGPAKK